MASAMVCAPAIQRSRGCSEVDTHAAKPKEITVAIAANLLLQTPDDQIGVPVIDQPAAAE